MVSARAGTVLLIFEHFLHLATFRVPPLFVLFCSRFRSDFRVDILFLCSIFECLSFYLFPSVPFAFRTDFARVLRALLLLTLF